MDPVERFARLETKTTRLEADQALTRDELRAHAREIHEKLDRLHATQDRELAQVRQDIQRAKGALGATLWWLGAVGAGVLVLSKWVIEFLQGLGGGARTP